MNFLVSLGVCFKSDDNCFGWVGLDNISDTIYRIAMENEKRSFIEDSNNLFNGGISPTIGNLAHKIIGIYIYYGEQQMNLKIIASIIAPMEEKARPILRRLYLVAFFLEQIGILVHTDKQCVYGFIPSCCPILIKVYDELSNVNINIPLAIFKMLNNIPNSFIKHIYNIRKKELNEKMVQSNIIFKRKSGTKNMNYDVI